MEENVTNTTENKSSLSRLHKQAAMVILFQQEPKCICSGQPSISVTSHFFSLFQGQSWQWVANSTLPLFFRNWTSLSFFSVNFISVFTHSWSMSLRFGVWNKNWFFKKIIIFFFSGGRPRGPAYWLTNLVQSDLENLCLNILLEPLMSCI